MIVQLETLELILRDRIEGRGIPRPEEIAWACAWLEACGYPGLKMLAEALADERQDIMLVRDAIGIDLNGVSCAFLAPLIASDVARNGRVYLRNVRHGLFILPFTVKMGLGIGCPIDPAFAVGGERTRNPYVEKLATSRATGVEVDDALWRNLYG